MRRILVILLVMVMGSAILTGCGNPMESFKSAADKTDRVASGKVSYSGSVDVEFYEEDLSADISKQLERYKKMTVEGENYFDKTKSESKNSLNLKVAEKGIDLKIYGRKDELYIVTPLLPKILVIKQDDLGSFKVPDKGEMYFVFPDEAAAGIKNLDALISKETIGKLDKYWTGLLEKGDAAGMGNIILSTPDGDVKARWFNINLTEAQLKPALKESVNIIRQDIMSKNKDSGKDLEKAFEALGEMLDSAKIDDFLYTANIDRDDYIVKDSMELKISFPEDKSGGSHIKSFGIKTGSMMWDMEKPVDIQFPAVNEKNSMTLDELQKQEEFPEGVF